MSLPVWQQSNGIHRANWYQTTPSVPYLSDHGLGEDLGSLGSTDDVGCLEEDLGSVLDGLQVPFFPRRHRCQNCPVDQLLSHSTHTERVGGGIKHNRNMKK